MPEITWQPAESLPGYTNLIIDGKVRGYVEHATRLPFWNFNAAAINQAHAGFTAIARRGDHPTVQSAMDSLLEYTLRLDAICDGTRGIQGVHKGCSPALCAPRPRA